MIGYIKGKVLEIIDGGVLLENNGIGYEVTLSATATERMVRDGEGGVYTYLQVKDDGLALYGFDTIHEKNMFLKLITVSGVGPKMGIGILSGMNLNQLALAIAESDVKALAKIKGCGKKTAERIILELRENISSLDIDGVAPVVTAKTDELSEDAVIALMGLGYNRAQSDAAVAKARESGADNIQAILTEALRKI